MNKQDNQLAISVLATLTTGIALIYTMILFHNYIFAVVGMSILFLITAFILTKNLIRFYTVRNNSLNYQLKHYIDDISSQLEAINGSQSQIGKATYLYTKRAAQAVSTLENNYIESQDALYKNLTALASIQSKATKLMIKYNQNNTNNVIASIKDMNSKINTTITHGFDQMQPDHMELITILETIVNELKEQSGEMNPDLGVQLQNIATELENISNNIQNVPISLQEPVPHVPVKATPTEPDVAPTETIQDLTAFAAENELDAAEPIAMENKMDVPTETTIAESDDSTLAEVIHFTTDTIQPEPMDIITDTTSPEDTTPVTDVPLSEEPSEPVMESSDKASNDMLSPDEIAALFAATEPTPKKKEEPSVPKEEPKADAIPDKQLSADEIAALFAAAEPAPKKEAKPKTTETIPEVPSTPAQKESSVENSNQSLSPDEIAALFAAAEPAPKKAEPAPISVSNEVTEHSNPELVAKDANKPLSPEEIAALFATMG